MNAPVEQFVQFIYGWQDVQISLERMSEIRCREEEDTPERTVNSFPNGQYEIRLQNVSFQYEGSHSSKVLDNLNLVIPQGKVTAIVGNSGSGKTTLIKLLLGYYPVVSGTIQIAGENLAHYNLRWWREHCGAVMQGGYLFSESIARNIAVGDDEIDKSRLLLAALAVNKMSSLKSLSITCGSGLIPNTQINRSSI